MFGHSLGGAVAIELCHLLKNRIKALILSESNLDPSSHNSASFEIANLSENNFDKIFKRKLTEYETLGNTIWVATLKNWLPKAALGISKNAVHVEKYHGDSFYINSNFLNISFSGRNHCLKQI